MRLLINHINIQACYTGQEKDGFQMECDLLLDCKNIRLHEKDFIEIFQSNFFCNPFWILVQSYPIHLQVTFNLGIFITTITLSNTYKSQHFRKFRTKSINRSSKNLLELTPLLHLD